MTDINKDYVKPEAVADKGVTKRGLFAGVAATLAASALATAMRPDSANAGHSGSLEAVWREARRRAGVLNAWTEAHPSQDLPTELVDWEDDPLYEAGGIAPRSEADWAALVLIALTIRPFSDSDDVLDEIEARCCGFGLPSPGSRV